MTQTGAARHLQLLNGKLIPPSTLLALYELPSSSESSRPPTYEPPAYEPTDRRTYESISLQHHYEQDDRHIVTDSFP